jgi:hypothetical protein
MGMGVPTTGGEKVMNKYVVEIVENVVYSHILEAHSKDEAIEKGLKLFLADPKNFSVDVRVRDIEALEC